MRINDITTGAMTIYFIAFKIKLRYRLRGFLMGNGRGKLITSKGGRLKYGS